jgi:hypothetical protein
MKDDQLRIIDAFVLLGKDIKENINSDDYQTVISKAQDKNHWFTKDSIETALTNLCIFFNEKDLKDFCNKYSFAQKQKKVAIICAGNIPMVAFHDILMALLSGNKALVKLSSNDDVLIPFLIGREKDLQDKVVFVDKIHDYDAVIATGSNNTARYFQQYFSCVPHLIRQNRSSVAIIQDQDTDQDLSLLAKDIFLYYGLGCRNVSCLFLPKGFDIQRLTKAFAPYSYSIDNHKYKNNYDYYKAVLIMNNMPFVDANDILLVPNDDYFSPVAVLNYTFYDDINEVFTSLSSNKDSLQCVSLSSLATLPSLFSNNHSSFFASHSSLFTSFGTTQQPLLSTFADGVDTMHFLNEI